MNKWNNKMKQQISLFLSSPLSLPPLLSRKINFLKKWKDRKLDVLSNQMHFKSSSPWAWSKQSFYITRTEFITSKEIPKIIKPCIKDCDKYIIDPLFIAFISYIIINLLLF